MEMEVNTKYNIGDSVWFVMSNKVQNAKVTGVNVSIEASKTIVTYTIHYGLKDNIDENLLFSTKEELLKSL